MSLFVKGLSSKAYLVSYLTQDGFYRRLLVPSVLIFIKGTYLITYLGIIKKKEYCLCGWIKASHEVFSILILWNLTT